MMGRKLATFLTVLFGLVATIECIESGVEDVLLAEWSETGNDSTETGPEPVLASMLWTKESGFQLVDGELTTSSDTVAWINYTNAINETGWSYLEIKTTHTFPDKIQAFAAGFLEGHVTAELLHMNWINTVDGYCKGKEELCQKILDHVNENTEWVHNKVQRHRSSDAYWHQVALFYDQLDGLAQGYSAKTDGKPEMHIPSADFLWMNIFGDLEDLEQVFNLDGHFDNVTRVLGSGSCSALIKLLPGNTDLFIAHDTWNSYQSMLRILKKYTFAYHWDDKMRSEHLIPGQTMSFSSYPGLIYSGDDFYLISTGLAVTETTIGNSNKDLWKYVKPRGQLLEGVRTMVANRLAISGKQWVKLFAKRNSGTYNNQWMVLDYNRFTPGQDISDVKGLLWVLEQLPGHVRADDVTYVLTGQSYWPSYNTPFFEEIFNLSGSPANVEKYGDWFTYDKTPRALIFERDHFKVVDIETMTKLMRYNDFQKDPLSQCDCNPPFSAENAISAREKYCKTHFMLNDLNPKNGTYPFGALGHRSHGGTDMKLTSYSMFQKLEFIAAGGPTFDDLPPFQWSKVDFETDCPHVGHPDIWTFQPVQHSWSLP